MTLRKISSLITEVPAEIDKLGFCDLILSGNFKKKYSDYVNLKKPGGFQNIEWKAHSAKILTTTGKSIFLPNYWFHIAAKLSFLIDDLREHQKLFRIIFGADSEDLTAVAVSLKSNDESAPGHRLKIDEYFLNSGLNEQEKSAFLEVVSDYPAWGGGKTVDRGDFIVSPLMKAAKLLAETQSGIAEIAEHLADKPDIRHSLIDQLEQLNSRNKTEAANQNSIIGLADATILPKPFLLLAGVSGTGKSRYVREQTRGGKPEELCKVIAVRPDWHEPSDLLGYVSRIGGAPKYIPTTFLIFLANAWKAAFDSAVGPELTLKPLNQIPTFWVCLDEMNLAPVEQYFADYLSVVETRKWVGSKYSCDPLVRPSELLKGEPEALNSMKSSLGLDGCDDLWSFFLEAGIPLPPNLVVAGTVNMDETTHGFSRKVIDRALTFDFGNFFPNDFDKYFGDQNQPKSLAFSQYSHAAPADLKACVPADDDGAESTQFLKDLNAILKDTPFELAYRALNELLVSLLCFKPKTHKELLAVWDDFLMCKLLPRLEGDQDKFTKNGTDVLDTLLDFVKTEFPDEPGNPTPRPDLLNTTHDGKELLIAYRSPAKLQWMKNRLSGGFTSFWP